MLKTFGLIHKKVPIGKMLVKWCDGDYEPHHETSYNDYDYVGDLSMKETLQYLNDFYYIYIPNTYTSCHSAQKETTMKFGLKYGGIKYNYRDYCLKL